MHLDDEQVQRLLHGELTQRHAALADDHLAACPECRSRVANAEREEAWVLDRLNHLDDPPPAVKVAAVMTRRRGVAWGRWAAGILMAIGVAGAAYAAPGSPLRRLVDRVTEWFAGDRPGAVKVESPPPADSVARGIAVTPHDRFIVVFAAEQRGSVATISLTEGTELLVRAVGGAATFTSDLDRLSVDNRSSLARFEIEIPRRAPQVEVWVGDRRVFTKQGSRVVSDGRRESEDRYLVPFFSAPR